MKKAKIITTVLIAFLFLLVASWLWKIELLALLVFVWRNEIREWINRKWKYGYRAVWIFLCAFFLISLPRAFALPTDRVRCHYIDREGNLTHTPVSHWLMNVIVPEEELCNFGIKLADFAGPFMGLGSSIMKDFYHDRERGVLSGFTKPYTELSWRMESPVSAAYTQGINDIVGSDDQAFYLIRPKHFDSDKEYLLIVFCHGYLGNWKLYNGIFKDIEDKLVLMIGTRGLSGIFSSADINSIHKTYIPLLEKMGYHIDMSEISLLGLSNGGSAIDAAYASYAGRFKNLVYISTGVNHFRKTGAKIMIIGGGLDHCAPSMLNGYRRLNRNGVDNKRFWDNDETHFIIVNRRDDIIRFLNENL